METAIAETDIKFCDEQPEEREERHKYKFYCPICLRYFTHMLQSACCQNYLCLLCAKDLQVREEKDLEFKAECPYKCGSTATTDNGGKFKLSDVPED